jgi:hypothetical protein
LSYIGTWRVPVIRQKFQTDTATLCPAAFVDMSSPYFDFQWGQIWQNTCFGWEGIVKLSYESRVLGLIQFSIQPEQEPENDQFIPTKQPGFLEVRYLEACQNNEDRLVDPIGKWLIWYAVQIAFHYCEGSKNGSILVLFSIPKACDYYRNQVQMEYESFTTLQQGIETTPFKFTKEGAESYCERLYEEYGRPSKISS